MSALIHLIEAIQKPLNFEGHYFLGIELDRYAHLIIAFMLSFIFFYFQKKKLGLVIVISLIFLKEVIDLGVIFYYEPIKWVFWKDSIIDLIMGFLGLALAIGVYTLLSKKSKPKLKA